MPNQRLGTCSICGGDVQARDHVEMAIEEHFAPPSCDHRYVRMVLETKPQTANWECATCGESVPGKCTVTPTGDGGFHVEGRLGEPE